MGILKASGLLKVVGQLYMTVYVHGYTQSKRSAKSSGSTIYDYLRPRVYTQSKRSAKSSGSTIYDCVRPWVYSKQAVC